MRDGLGKGEMREPEETLRKLAGMPAPKGLEDRVHRRLRLGSQQRRPAGLWSLWMPARRMQFAGAAVLAIAVAGSAWTMYRAGWTRTGGAGTEIPAPSEAPGKNFGAAAARGVPDTVTPIPVPESGGRMGTGAVAGGVRGAKVRKKKPSAKGMVRRPEKSATVATRPAD